VVVSNAYGNSVTSAVAVLVIGSPVVAPAPSSLALVSSENPAGFKDGLIFTANVAPAGATGTVAFLTNGVAFDVEPLAGAMAASASLASLPRGTNLVTAIYGGDAADLPATNGLAQVVTNHPPVVAPAFYTRMAGQTLTIAMADLATNWSDPDGDPLFIADISPSTNGVVVTNALPVLFYANPNDVNDQFVCTISDGLGGTNDEIVNIAVLPETNAVPRIAVVSGQPGGLLLQLNGAYGSTYILETTTDFVSGAWVPLATNSPGLTGAWRFTDGQAADYPRRFYRLELAP